MKAGKNPIQPGDKVKSNGKYEAIDAKFGDTVHIVRYVGEISRRPVIWLECGGGCFCADGFTVVKGNN